MSENNKIDDIFKNFKDYSAKSPAEGWSQVSNKVFYNNITALLTNMSVKVQHYLWGNISKQLIWHNFLHFSFSTFNVFYLSAIILLSSLVFLLTNKNNTPFLKNKNLITESSVLKVIPINDNNTKENCSHLQDKKVINNNNIKPLTTNFVASSSTQKIQSNNEVSGEMITSNNIKVPEIIEHTANIKTNNNSQLSNNMSSHFQSQTVLDNSKKDLTNLVDTFVVYDTIHFYDTLSVIQKNQIDYSRISKGYSLSFYFSSLFGNSEFSSVNNPNLAEINNRAFASSMSIEGGIDFEVSMSQSVFLRTGIGMLRIGEDFSYEQTKMKIDTTVKPSYVSNQFYTYLDEPTFEVDTLNIYPVVTYIHHQDGSITTDTAWYYHTDTIEVIVKDSILTVVNDTIYETVYDTSYQHYFYEFANRYTYLQIPLIFTYKIGKGKLSYDFAGGIINEFFLNAKGKGIDFKDTYEVVDINKAFPFMKYNMSIYIGCGISYKIEENVSIFTEGFYRRNINSAFQNNFVLSKSFAKFGIKAGLKFNF